MDRERLSELLQDPSHVAKEDLTDLRSMAERFPWFSGAHLLLAVGEHETGDVLANDRRSQPAAFLPSRSVLFDLVHKEEPYDPTALRVVKNEEPVAESNSEVIPSAATAPEPTEAIKPPPPVEEKKSTTPEVTYVPLEKAESPLKPEAAKEEEAPQAPEPDIEREVLDRQIVEAVHASGYDLAQLAKSIQPQVIPLPNEEEQVIAMESAHPLPEPPARLPAPAPIPKKERPIPGPNARFSFTDWLSQDESPIFEEEAPAAPAQPDVILSTSSDGTTPAPDALSQLEIMDHFIHHATPAPATEKAVFFSPQKAAKRSLEDAGLVSETLAKIHEKQGNFAKAREVYDRLAVKHPEKSVYFAALSKALEARSNK